MFLHIREMHVSDSSLLFWIDSLQSVSVILTCSIWLLKENKSLELTGSGVCFSGFRILFPVYATHFNCHSPISSFHCTFCSMRAWNTNYGFCDSFMLHITSNLVTSDSTTKYWEMLFQNTYYSTWSMYATIARHTTSIKSYPVLNASHTWCTLVE